MVTINIVHQDNHAWEATYPTLRDAKAAIPGIVKQHGDIDRVELLTDDGPVDIWTCQWSRAAATIGKLGGSRKSERKAASSAENGRKGGRPRKSQ